MIATSLDPQAVALLPPGAHVALLSSSSEGGIRGRMLGLALRDTLLVLGPEAGTRLVFLFRKDLSEGTVAENVLKHGTGALNIEKCRVEYQGETDKASASPGGKTTSKPSSLAGKVEHPGGERRAYVSEQHAIGRWPSNLVFVHAAGCARAGTKRVAGTSIPRERPTVAVRRSGTHAKAGGHQTVGRSQPVHGHADPDGRETVAAWVCVQGCPVAKLDEQTGELHGAGNKQPSFVGARGYSGGWQGQKKNPNYHQDSGVASRFYPQFADDEELMTWLATLIEGVS